MVRNFPLDLGIQSAQNSFSRPVKYFLTVFFFLTLFFIRANGQGMVKGYFPYYRSIAEVNAVQYDKVTDIIYSFASIDGSGNLAIMENTSGLFNALKTKCQQNNVRLWVAIGGWGLSGSFPGVAASATSRNNLANNCLTLCNTHGLAGIDIDWEFPSASDKTNYTAMLAAIKASIGPSGRKLSAALGGESFTYSCVNKGHAVGVEAAAFTHLDYFNIMSYDAPGCFSNHTSLDFLQRSMDGWNALGCPFSKMIPGMAFYTGGGAMRWKDMASSAYFNDADGILNGYNYDSKATIEAKVNYAMCSKGAPGVMVWELSQDVDGTNPLNLTTVMYNAVQACGCPFGNPNLGADQSICGVSSITLNSGIAAATNRNFSWKKDGVTIAGTNPTLSITAAGTYEVTISQSGCTKTDQIVITNTLAAPDFTGTASALCATLPFTLTPSNLSSFPGGTTWQWQRGGVDISGATSSSLSGIRTAGVYKLTATAGSCSSNSTKTLTSNVATPVDGSGPSGSAIPLSITNATGGPYNWYSASTGGTSLATGTSYSPVVSSTTTYYVQDGATTSFYVGPTGIPNNWEGGASDSYYINFTVSSTSATIAEVDVYVPGWVNISSVVVKIWSSTGSLLFTSPVASYNNGSSSAKVKLTVPVGYNAAPGNYRLSVLASGNLLTNTLPSFPITNNNVSLTGVGGSLGAYPYAMNWKIGGGSNCARLPVIATVTASVPLPTVTTPVTYCQNGTASALSATPSSGGTLKWYGTSQTGGTSSSTAPVPSTSVAGTVSYYVSQTVGGVESARAKIDVIVNPTPTITNTAPGSRCGAGTVVLGATASAGTLNWYASSSGGTSLRTGASFTTPSISTTTTYYVAATNASCTSARTAVVATINQTPTITGTTPNSRCGTGTVILGATASAGTLNWYAAAAGGTSLGTGTSFTTPSITVTTTYYVAATNASCTSARTSVVATINPIPTITGTTPNSRCGTGTVVLGATASAGTLNWYAAASGGTSLRTGASFTTPSITATTTYYVAATNASCTSSRTAVVATVNQTPTITGTTPNSRCGTGTVVLGATASAGTLNWYAAATGGSSLGTGTSFTTPSISSTTTYYVATTNNGCTSARTAVIATISSTITPLVSVAASQTTICSGSSVTFTATPTNAGSTPSYQWKRNGTNVGTNSTTFTTSTINNGDVFTVVLTSNSACASPTTATSTGTTITVSSSVAPSVTVAASQTTICSGTSVTFTATPTNGGSTPSYQWKRNGTNVGTNSATFTTSTINNGDVFTVVLTSNSACASPTTATSAGTTMTVSTSVNPSVTVDASQTTICSGSSVIFTATPTNGGSTPSYQWKRNGTNVGTNSATFTTSTINNGDVFTVVLTSNSACAASTTATSPGTTMIVNSAPQQPGSFLTSISTVNPSQNGVGYSIAPVSGANSYNWTYNGAGATINGNGNTNITINFSANASSGVLSVTAVNTCGSSNPLTLSITVNSLTTPNPGPFTTFTNPVNAGTSGVMYCVANVPGTTYTWNYSGDGVTLIGAGTNCVTIDYANFATSGTLSVTANNGNGPSTPSTLDIIVDKSATGVNGPIEGVALNAFPNPFEYTSIIRIDLQSGSEVSMDVYDVYGVKVESLMKNEYLGSGSHDIEVNGLASGVYFVRLKIGEREKTIKIIKQQ